MPEKLIIGITGALAAALAVFAKITMVSKKHLFDSKGKPLFMYSSDCALMQKACSDRQCKKLEELKLGQRDVHKKLDRLSENYHILSESVVAIRQWIDDTAERRKLPRE